MERRGESSKRTHSRLSCGDENKEVGELLRGIGLNGRPRDDYENVGALLQGIALDGQPKRFQTPDMAKRLARCSSAPARLCSQRCSEAPASETGEMEESDADGKLVITEFTSEIYQRIPAAEYASLVDDEQPPVSPLVVYVPIVHYFPHGPFFEAILECPTPRAVRQFLDGNDENRDENPTV